MSNFPIGHLPLAELKPNPRNARRHSQKQLVKSPRRSGSSGSTAWSWSMKTASFWSGMVVAKRPGLRAWKPSPCCGFLI